MEEDKDQSREYVEAVPGPAIVISKDTYKKMQENNNAKQNQERLKKVDEIVGKFRKHFEKMSYEEREKYLEENGFDFGSSDENIL